MVQFQTLTATEVIHKQVWKKLPPTELQVGGRHEPLRFSDFRHAYGRFGCRTWWMRPFPCCASG
jgi:hypothetical protein